MTWHLYIARCGDGSLYTGVTMDPKRRMQQHNTGKGSAYVRSKGVASLAYVERCPDKPTAQRREREVKSWNRQKKLLLVTAQRKAKQLAPFALVSPKSRRAMETR